MRRDKNGMGRECWILMQEVRVGKRRRRGRKGRHGREKICMPGFGFGLHTLSYLRASIKGASGAVAVAWSI